MHESDFKRPERATSSQLRATPYKIVNELANALKEHKIVMSFFK